MKIEFKGLQLAMIESLSLNIFCACSKSWKFPSIMFLQYSCFVSLKKKFPNEDNWLLELTGRHDIKYYYHNSHLLDDPVEKLLCIFF